MNDCDMYNKDHHTKCEELINSGYSIDDLLQYLMSVCPRLTFAIGVFSQVFDISIGDAKEIVLNSNSWANKKDDVEEIHKTLIEILKADAGWIKLVATCEKRLCNGKPFSAEIAFEGGPPEKS